MNHSISLFHRLIAIGGIVLVLAGLIIYYARQRPAKSLITIGITQTASHPALDAARQGFEDTLIQKFGKDVAFITKNAQGAIAQSYLIAQGFQFDPRIDGIFALATPAAQTAAQQTGGKPLFIAAVTDPASAGLTNPSVPACGSTDNINADHVVEIVRTLIPKAKKIALLYNQADQSAQDTSLLLRNALKAANYTVTEVTVSRDSEMPLAVEQAISESDVIITPIDNTVALTISLITQKTRAAKKPLIVSDNLLVEHGALAGAGVNYYDSGVQTGQCAIEVLTGQKTSQEIGFVPARSDRTIINKKTLDILGLTVPPSYQDRVEFIQGDHS